MTTDRPSERPGDEQLHVGENETQRASDTPESGAVINLFPTQQAPASAPLAAADPNAPDEHEDADEWLRSQRLSGPQHQDVSAELRIPAASPGAASGVAEGITPRVAPVSAPQTPAAPLARAMGAARLLVVGVGGAGCNIVNHMIASNMRGVEFVAINTDTQALNRSQADVRLAIGAELTRGMGTGGQPAIGQQAAQESYHELVDALDGADMVFITAGMGGGTGTGASPIIAQAAREVGALTLAIVTTPFAFERRRRALAEQGVAALRTVVDALITVPNERLAQLVGRDTSIFEAYRLADEALRVGVQGVSDLITIPGLVNLDFADVRSIMANAGSAYLATGSASGEGRAENALRSALSNPLLDVDITGARGLIFNVTGGDDLSMREVEQIANALTAAVHPDANLIFGATYDQEAGNSLKVTVVATGFEPHVAPEARPSTWTPGRIPLAPGARDTRPDLSAARQPSRPPEPSLPGRMVFDEPLPHLSQPPGQSYSSYGWVTPPPPWAQPAPPPYQQSPYQQPPQAGQQGGVAVTPVNPPSPGQPVAQPGPTQGPARPAAQGGQRSGADHVVNPHYPREEYAENTEEQEGAHPHEQTGRQGFWSRLFSSNPSNAPDPPHPTEGQHP